MTVKKTKQPDTTDKAMEGELLPKQSPDNNKKRDQELTEIDATYGDGTPYTPERMENEIKFYFDQAQRSLFEIGRRLILIKEHEPHGEFLNTLERLDFDKQAAERYMKVVRRLSGKKERLAELGKSKALELLVLDDEPLEDLAKGGTIAGKTLDDIDKMSVRELRQTVRQEKQKSQDDRESLEKLLDEKNKKIDEQIQKINKLENLTENWDEQVKLVSRDIADISTISSNQIDRIEQLCLIIKQYRNGEQNEDPAKLITLHDQLQSSLIGVYDRLMNASSAANSILGIPTLEEYFRQFQTIESE